MAIKVEIPVGEIIKEVDVWVEGLTEEVAEEIRLEAISNSATAFDDETKHLRRSIMVRKRRNGNAVVGVFAPHAHLVEFGHILRKRGKNKKTPGRIPTRRGQSPQIGHVPARPFFIPAIYAVESRLHEIITDVRNGITIIVKK